MEYKIGDRKLELQQGDITKQSTDCIVNAANSDLAHGGGVARAIADAAGEELQKASKEAPKVPTGEIYTTPAGNLDAKWVIHAVGPVWRGGDQDEAKHLRYAVENSLEEADKLEAKSISFPAISTGIYGFPIRKAAKIMLETTKQYMSENDTGLQRVKFVLFTEADHQVFVTEFESMY